MGNRPARTPTWRGLALAVLGPALVCSTLALLQPPLLAALTSAVYDILVRSVGARPPAGSVVIVDVDERSLRDVGQWPWNRGVMARLVASLRAMGARAIALDIIFSEPDRSSSPPADGSVAHAAAASASPPDGDAQLADTLRGGSVVVGYAMTFEAIPGLPGGTRANAGGTRCLLHPSRVVTVVAPAVPPDASLFRAADAICTLPAFAEAAGASGFLNAAPDADGVLRRVPLLLELGGESYPGLALAAVIAATGTSAVEFRVANANSSTLVLGDREIPLDGRANLLLRYRGPGRTFPHVSATDVLAGRAPAGTFKDRIVFVGATALGMQDLVSTPHDRFFSGVEVQATIADDLLQGDFARRPELAIVAELLLVLGMCAVVAIVIGRLGVLAGVLAAVAAAGVLVAGLAWLLHGTGLVLSPVLPLVGTGVGLAAATIATLAGERRAAIAGLQGARRETERAAHVKDEFLMTVSHELRTPLTAIYGYAQMLAKGALKDEQRSRAIATIERNARAQTQLIDDLLDASQVLAGRLRLDMAGVDLGALVQSVADALQPAIDAKRLALGVKLAPLEPIPGDPDRLRQVVWHLLSNAIKFTPEGGRVDVRLERSGAHALLTVSDTGIGIAPEFIPVMFDQFRQEDASTKRTFGGLGIGLTLVRYVVELHGGTVRATSQGPGHGAVLSVRLPLEAMAPAVSMANMVKSGSIRLDGVRVLVVDDQVEARTLAGATLLNAGARPVTAANPADALAIFASSEVDVIVVSLDMPEDGGYRIADEAVAINAGRDAQLRPDVQIVAMCANPSSGDARAALAPIALRIAKPIDPVQLVSVIAALTHREIRSTNGGQA